ncbi:hypothetical protein, partial [Burkholderia sp. BCC0397]|uniref:beta strand repeat-containing protein n=1 Tax=Burkholderia sp. BCC0397 TaxID=486876 RepID=UPI00158EC7C6
MNRTIDGTEGIWGGNPPSSAVLNMINASPLLAQSINKYDIAIQEGTAAPIGAYIASDGNLYSNGKETIVNSANQVQILLGAQITSSSETNPSGYVSALTWEMGKFAYFNQGQLLYNGLANLNPNDQNYGNAAATVGTVTEAWSAAFSYQVQQQMASTPGFTFTIDGDGPNNANGAIQQTLSTAWQNQNLANASSTDAFAALTTAAVGVIGTFPAVNGESYPDIYQKYPAALQQEYSSASLNKITTNPPSDISGISIDYSNGNISSSTMAFNSGQREIISFANNQVSTAIYTDSSGNILSDIVYVHNSDDTYSSTITDGSGKVVSTQSFSSSGAETQTFSDPSSIADVNAPGLTLTTNANTIDVNGADYDTTILNGNHVINAQAGDTFQLTGVGYNVNLSATGGASTVTFEANSGGTVNGSAATVNITGSGSVVTIGGNGQSASASNDNYVNFASGASGTLTVEGNSRTDVSGSGLAVYAGGNESLGVTGSGNTVDATGSNNGIWLNGANAVVNLSGQGDSIYGSNNTIYGENSDTFTVNGSGDTITDGTSSTTTIEGSNDTLSYVGGGSTVSVLGQNDTIDGASVTIYGQNNDTFSVNGSGDTITDGTSSTTTIEGSNDTLSYVGGGSTVSVLGQNDTIDGASVTIYGQNNDTFSVNGSGDMITDGTSSTTTIEGSNDTLSYVGGGSTVSVLGQNDTIDGASVTIYGQNNDTFSVNGSGDTITDGTSSTTTIEGGNDTLSYVGGGSTVNVLGQNDSIDGSSVTIYGQNNDTFKVDGSGDTITDGTGSTTNINGSNDTLSYVGGGSTVNVLGQNDTIDGASVTIYGQNSDTFSVNGSGDTITNGASSTTIINGNNDTLSYIGGGSTVDIAGQDDHIDGNNDTINFSGTDTGDIVDGSGDTGAGWSGIDYVDQTSSDPFSDGGYGGYYGGYGFSGDRSAVQSKLASDVTAIAQYDQHQGNAAAANAAKNGFAQAGEMARDTATSAGSGPNVLEGARWDASTITWNFDSANGPQNGQYEKEVEQAFATWAAA